jgi:hypothetical protein
LLKSEVAMNSLHFLEYAPGGSESLGLLMANLRAPGMIDLHLSLRYGDMPITLRCGTLFSTAVNMRVSCVEVTEENIRALYAITPAVSTLDIVYTPLRFHYGLYEDGALPQLRTLVRHDIWFEMLYNLGRRRQGLQRLVLYRPQQPVIWESGMTGEEMAEMLKLVDSVEYVDVTRKEWYM